MGKLKFGIGDKVIGNDKKASFRDRRGTVVKYWASTGQYVVRFDDENREEYVNPWWLDKDNSL